MQSISKFFRNNFYILWYKKKSEYSNPWYFLSEKVLSKFKKIPHKIHIGKYQYILGTDPIKNYPIIIAFNGLGWKTKYSEVRYETPPNILFKFFNFEFRITLTWGDVLTDTIYWESILEYLYENKSIEEIINSNTWINNDKKETSLITLNLLK